MVRLHIELDSEVESIQGQHSTADGIVDEQPIQNASGNFPEVELIPPNLELITPSETQIVGTRAKIDTVIKAYCEFQVRHVHVEVVFEFHFRWKEEILFIHHYFDQT